MKKGYIQSTFFIRTVKLRTGRANKAETLNSRVIANHLALDRVPTLLIGTGIIPGIDTIIGYSVGVDTIIQQVQDFQFIIGFHQISPSQFNSQI